MKQGSTSLLELRRNTDIFCGSGSHMRTLDTRASEIARTNLAVLLIGESGSGKDTYARLIHGLSRANDCPFLKINCMILDPKLLTARIADALVTLEAHPRGGTLYLDNLQELDPAGQRAVFSQLSDAESVMQRQDGCTRIVSSTTRGLDREVESGSFRRELYFRVNGASLILPPLRERKEDIASLLEYFLLKHSSSPQTSFCPLSQKAVDILVSHHWPGNIRELENFAMKVSAFGDLQVALQELQLGCTTKPPTRENAPACSLKTVARAASRQAEREMIMHALERTLWNRKRAAHELQISYKSLLYKIKQIGPLH
jgi:two-component system, NtrC family, response regulator AtoC